MNFKFETSDVAYAVKFTNENTQFRIHGSQVAPGSVLNKILLSSRRRILEKVRKQFDLRTYFKVRRQCRFENIEPYMFYMFQGTATPVSSE
jgi:hypothetical protein